MPDQSPGLLWTQRGWLEQASAWIHVELERLNISLSGPLEQPHVRPWSTVLRVPTNDGDLYFKASAPVLLHETGLTQVLSRWRPDCMPEVLATDLKRGWMLMRDGGYRLRSLIQTDREIRHWQEVLPIYAKVQIEMVGRVRDLLALGTPDRRLAVLPTRYKQLLADTGALRIALPEGLTSEEYQRLHELAPRVAADCEQLASFGIPETLQHDDFHDGNIFVQDGRYIFFDWGDSCVAHPFFTLVVTLRSVSHRLKLTDGATELEELRDVYLEPWTRYESPEHLLRAFTLARRLGIVCRALTWHHIVSSLEEPFQSEYAEAVPGWLHDFLAAENETLV